MTKVLWLSRHKATEDQVVELNKKLDGVKIVHVSTTVANAKEVLQLRDENACTEMVVVLPPAILADLTNPRVNRGSKPIRAVMERVQKSETEVEFVHSHFERVERIQVVTTPL